MSRGCSAGGGDRDAPHLAARSAASSSAWPSPSASCPRSVPCWLRSSPSLAAATPSFGGAVLLGLYAVGFGIPFVALALGLQRATASLSWLRPNLDPLQRAGGVLLVGVGVLFITGTWRTFFIPIAAELSRLGWPPI